MESDDGADVDWRFADKAKGEGDEAGEEESCNVDARNGEESEGETDGCHVEGGMTR